MARKSRRVLTVSENDAPRDHFYITVCIGISLEWGSVNSPCEWVEVPGRSAVLKAHREARTHARRNPDHESQVLDLSAMRVVTRYRYSAISGMDDRDDPLPF